MFTNTNITHFFCLDYSKYLWVNSSFSVPPTIQSHLEIILPRWCVDIDLCCSQAVLLTQAAPRRHTQQDWTLRQQVRGSPRRAIHQITTTKSVPFTPPLPPPLPLPCLPCSLTLLVFASNWLKYWFGCVVLCTPARAETVLPSSFLHAPSPHKHMLVRTSRAVCGCCARLCVEVSRDQRA